MESYEPVKGETLEEALEDFKLKMKDIILESKLPFKYVKLRLDDALFAFYFKVNN